MNRSGKRMQPAWPKSNDVKWLQSWAPSKRATFDDTNNEEYCVVMLEDVDEVLETMQIEEESPIDDEIQPIETFVESESATDFKGFEALHNIVLDIDDQLLCSDVQMEVGCVRWNATIIWDVSMKR